MNLPSHSSKRKNATTDSALTPIERQLMLVLSDAQVVISEIEDDNKVINSKDSPPQIVSRLRQRVVKHADHLVNLLSLIASSSTQESRMHGEIHHAIMDIQSRFIDIARKLVERRVLNLKTKSQEIVHGEALCSLGIGEKLIRYLNEIEEEVNVIGGPNSLSYEIQDEIVETESLVYRVLTLSEEVGISLEDFAKGDTPAAQAHIADTWAKVREGSAMRQEEAFKRILTHKSRKS